MLNQLPDGKGIFETLLVRDGRILYAKEHYERALGTSTSPLPNFTKVLSASETLLNQSGLFNARLRWFFLEQFSVAADAFELDTKKVHVKVGGRLLPDSHIKSFPYRNGRFADPNYDDVLLTTTDGLLAESCIANILYFIDGEWLTPRRELGILPGIMREELIQKGAAREADIALSELESIESMVLINSLRLRPVQSIDSLELALPDIASFLSLYE